MRRLRYLFLLTILFACLAAHTQNLSLLPIPRPQFFDSTGNPLAGGYLYSYAAGTSTPLNTYTDVGGTIPNANPITLNAAGMNPQGPIFLSPLAYKFVLYSSGGQLQWSADNVSSWNNLSGVNLVDAVLTNPTINGGTLNNVNIVNGISVNESLTNPTIVNATVSGGTYTNPNLVNPTITGGGSWSGGPTISSPTLTTPVVTNPTVSLGTFSNPSIASPSVNLGRIVNPTIVGGVIDNTPIGKTIPADAAFRIINLALAGGGKILGTDSNGNMIETGAVTPAGANSTATNGYAYIGNIIIQWTQGASRTGVEDQTPFTTNFPIAFPTSCLWAAVAGKTTGTDYGEYPVWNTISWTSSSITYYYARNADHSGMTVTPLIFAIGY